MPLWQAVASSGTQFFLDRHDIIRGDLEHTLCPGRDFKDLAWDNYILRMKGQETVITIEEDKLC